MKRLLAVMVLLASPVFAQWATPARQISVSTNGWGWIDPAANTVQGALDFIDDNQTDWAAEVAQIESNRLGVASNAVRIAALEGVESNHYISVTNRLGALESVSPPGFDWARRDLLVGLRISTDGGNADIDIGPGFGFCNTDFFALEAATNIHVVGVSSNADFYYIYVSATSAFPEVTLRVAATEPSKVTSVDQWGWYDGDDRCIGAVHGVSQGFTKCFMGDDFTMLVAGGLKAHSLKNGDAAPEEDWQYPARTTDTLTPINITGIQVAGVIYEGEDRELEPAGAVFPSSPSFIAVRPDDLVSSPFNATGIGYEFLSPGTNYVPTVWSAGDWATAVLNEMVPVYESRSLEVWGQGTSDGADVELFELYVNGWRFDR